MRGYFLPQESIFFSLCCYSGTFYRGGDHVIYKLIAADLKSATYYTY